LENERAFVKELVVIGILTVISSIVVIQTISRIPHSLPTTQKIFNQQSQIITKLLENKIRIEIDFGNKQTNFDCFKLNYALSPYSNKGYMEACYKAEKVESPKPKKEDFEWEGESKLNYIINNRCQVLYRPFLNQLDFICNN